MRELQALGVEVEPERWWDDTQRGDILHYVGRPPSIGHVRFAHDKGFKVVMTENLDMTASRSRPKLFLQRAFTRLAQTILPGLTNRLAWEVYRELDAMVYVVPHEWEVAQYLFGANTDRGYVIPHGMENEALEALSRPEPEGDYLISVATITPRKNTILLAEAAHEAKVPIVFLGKPYSAEDPYFLRFQSLVDQKFVRYPGFVSEDEKYSYIRRARGFALLSEFESGCIAIYEAGAAGLPLFLSDLPWANKVYADAQQRQFVNLKSPQILEKLASFYSKAHRLPEKTFPILTWREVAQRYVAIYDSLLKRRPLVLPAATG
jgi:glycosyltransferase involved in cell wall biosynthesis